MSSTARTDPSLLLVARRVLEANGFEARDGTIPETAIDWLLAENELFILAVATGVSADDLLVLESYAGPALSELLADERIGAKRWDAHLVLLAAESGDERGMPELVALEHNTRALRRVVSLGVSADEQHVRNALSLFLPLPESGAYVLTPPLEELQEQLGLHGLDPDMAEAAVAAFRANGSLDAL